MKTQYGAQCDFCESFITGRNEGLSLNRKSTGDWVSVAWPSYGEMHICAGCVHNLNREIRNWYQEELGDPDIGEEEK